MTPEAMRHEDVARYVLRELGGATRVLEVGCGRGELARMLAGAGLEVTALDRELRDIVNAPGVRFVEHDFCTFEHAPFDALIFTTSFHHIAPLDRAVAAAARLVRPDGLAIFDEFDVEAPDAPTLRWYYDTQELLAAAGLYPTERIDPPIGDASVVTRWRDQHHHHEPLHGGAAMLRALGELFDFASTARLEYLCRYIGYGLAADRAGARIAEHLRSVERAKIASGEIRAVGLRMIARPR